MQILKKIDILLIRSFLPPFIAAFFIAMFVLIMQFLWSFIDEIIGKGVSAFDLFELMFYRSLTLIPLALPIGILLSSVMVFGNLSERYELSALKSAGVSLFRIMAPIVGCGILVAAFSLYTSDKLIPLSMLKFQSRLWDIRNQKPALSLEESIFNDDFDNFTIRIGSKHRDNRTIEDIIIYDHSTSSRRNYNMLVATKGEMYISDDQQDFVMKLYDGYQYQEVDQSGGSRHHAFARTHFTEYTKFFSLSEFELGQIDESLFESHHMMKSMGKLVEEIDSIDARYFRNTLKGLHDFNNILSNREAVNHILKDESQPLDSAALNIQRTEVAKAASGAEQAPRTNPGIPVAKQANNAQLKRARYRAPLMTVLDTLPADADWNVVYASFNERSQKQFVTSATSRVKAFRDNSRRLKASQEVIELNRIGHVYELNIKMALAMMCIIFLFIGAPMGAIVRKGGYGYPLLVSIVFFTVYIILTIMFDKLADGRKINAILAAWAPCLIILPISAFLTYKAMNDSKLLSAGKLFSAIGKLLAAKEKPKAAS